MRVPPQTVRDSWPKPNYIDPVTRGPALLIVEATILPLALIVLLMRLYVRIVLLKSIGWDDWLMVAASVFGSGVSICVVLASNLFGWDMHVWDVLPGDMVAGRKVSLAVQALFVLATSLAKVSILVSYLRFAPRNTWFRRWTQMSISVISVGNAVFLVVLFAQCTPLTSYWNFARGPTDCLPEAPPLMSQAVFTVLADFVVWVLPLPTLMRAQLPSAQRLALIILFSCGLFVVFGAIMRTYWIWVVVEGTYDVTWEGFHLWIWTAVEVHLGLICGCIPTLKALVKSWKSKRKNSRALGDSRKSLGGGKEEGGKYIKMSVVGSKSDTKTEVELGAPRTPRPGSEDSDGTKDARTGTYGL